MREEPKLESLNLENQKTNDCQKLMKMMGVSSAKCFFKAAEYCARKFTKVNQEKRTEYFLRYCRKKYCKSKTLWKTSIEELSNLFKEISENNKTNQNEETFNLETKETEEQFKNETQAIDPFLKDIIALGSLCEC